MKNGKSVLDKLLTYQLPDGSFCHDDSFDAYATMQALWRAYGGSPAGRR